MRRFVSHLLIVFSMSLFAISVFADLTASINNLVAREAKNEKVGIYVQNIEDGSVLYAYNSNEAFTPASTTKVFTAAAAYLSLGPQYHYITSLSTNASMAQNLKGNVYLRFSGDPTLTILNIDALFYQLRRQGVREISGDVVLDQSIFSGSYYGSGWTPDDIDNCYGAPITGAIIDNNCSRIGVVKYPNFYAQQIITNAVRHAGIRLNGKVIEGVTPKHTTTIATHDSNSLQAILDFMLKYSDDVYANAIFKTMGKAYVNSGSYAGGSFATDMILASHIGKNFSPPQLKDGSGLSTMNLITPEQLVALYDYMYHEPGLSDYFRQSLAISGQGGTLVYRLNNRLLDGRVFAKTGTFHHDKGGVSSLAGYLILPGHPVISFAIMMNDISGDTSRAESLQDQIVQTIAENEVN